MIIYNQQNQQICTIAVDDDSYRYQAIMQAKKVELRYSLPGHLEIPVGSYIDFQGERYTMWYPENFKKKGTREFDYAVTFGGNEEILSKYKFKLLSQKPYQLKFPLTATPRMFIQLLVDNLNLYDEGWTVGSCIEATEKPISFSHEDCYTVLSRLASEFNTEWEIVGKAIHFKKVEKFKDAPIALSYGKGNGFVPGVGRSNQGDKRPITLLYVQGGERNIDYLQYGSQTLLLPRGQELEYEGRCYKTDQDGMYITRSDRELTNYNEDSFDASNIYPSRVGEVTAVTTEAGKDTEGKPVTFYNIVDTTIPDALNYRDCRLDGSKATIIFQSGVLTGREFDIVQTDDNLTGYDHTKKTFKLVPLSENNLTLPNEHLKPSVGDKYAVFNISLPVAYVCDNTTKTGASWDMFREAVRYFYENEEAQFAFSGELDGIWAKKNWLAIGGKLVPGGYVDFSDTQFQPEGILIRITGVTDYINKPHSPKLELSNTPVAGFLADDMGKIDGNEVTTDKKHKEALSLTQRRWRDMQETGKMLEKAIEGFSAAINPITVSTMQVRVGSEQLQYRFVTNKTTPTEYIPDFIMNDGSRVFTAPGGIVQHMTLGIDSISVSHAVSEYSFWDIETYTSPYLGDDKPAYYLYLKCAKTGSKGTYLLTRTAYPDINPGDGFYYFLVGTLGTEFDGVRSFEAVYGYTEILPGRMTIGLIKSYDGSTYFNLTEGVIAGNIHIKSGSGYDNITDRPDLGVYATYSDFSVLNDSISGVVRAVDENMETIMSSGFIVKADATTIFAAELAKSGDKIISYINVQPGNIKISAKNIELDGRTIADAIEANDITTGRLTVTNGGRIGGFDIDNDNFSGRNGSGISMTQNGDYCNLNCSFGHMIYVVTDSDNAISASTERGNAIYASCDSSGHALTTIGNVQHILSGARMTLSGVIDNENQSVTYSGYLCIHRTEGRYLLMIKQ